jgi:putative addiction module component (TIGR02574 family)
LLGWRDCHGLKSALKYVEMDDLREQIDSLSTEQKTQLLDAVWESIEADAKSLTETQRNELDRRIARHRENSSDVIPWEKVRASLFRKS